MTSSEIDKLINQISKPPGLGRRSAQRIALYLLKNKDRSLLPLLQCLQEAKKKIVNCENCGNIDTITPCSLCSNSKRDVKSICVVEGVSDLWTFERIGFYRGMYHVLGGSLSAINGIGIDEIAITKLIKRIEKNNLELFHKKQNRMLPSLPLVVQVSDLENAHSQLSLGKKIKFIALLDNFLGHFEL